MTAIKSHEDLVAWRLSDQLEDRVYEIPARSAARKDRDFCDDIQRSGRSGPANLSEAFHRFRPRDMARFARIALGSIGETINHLRHAHKRKYITDQEHEEWTALATRARKATIGWLTYLDSCPREGARAPFQTVSISRKGPKAPTTDSTNEEPNDEP
jgi:four helix bundle protein